MAKDRFFRTTRDGQTVILDRAQGVLYNDSGQLWDPVTSTWRDDPARKEKKEDNKFAQLGYVAAGPMAYAAGQSAAGGIGGLFGLGSGAAGATGAATAGAGAAVPAAAGAAGAAGAGAAGTAAGAGATGATGGGMASLGSSLGMAPGVSMLPALAAAPVAAAGAYGTITGVNNLLKGKDLDLLQQASLALPTFGLSFLSNEFGSGKDKDQQSRDSVRQGLQESGFADENWNIKNADGSTFNIGMDGDAMLQNAGGGQRRYFDVDFDDPRAASVVGAADALATILTEGDNKLKTDFSGYFTNAALSSGDPMDNIRAQFQQAGFDKETAWAKINALEQAGKIDQQTGHILRNSLNNTFDEQKVAPPQAAGAPQAGFQQVGQDIPSSSTPAQLPGGKALMQGGLRANEAAPQLNQQIQNALIPKGGAFMPPGAPMSYAQAQQAVSRGQGGFAGLASQLGRQPVTVGGRRLV